MPSKNRRGKKKDPISPQGQFQDLVVVILLLAQAAIIAWFVANIDIEPITKTVLLLFELLTAIIILEKIFSAFSKLLKAFVSTSEGLFELWYQISGRITGRIRSGEIKLRLPDSDKEISISYTIDDKATEDMETILKSLAKIQNTSKE